MSADRYNGLGDELPEAFTDDFNDRADRCRDELADLEDTHTYPATLTEGALFKRQAD